MEKPTKPRKNADLWKQVLRLCEKHDVTAGWVKAHNGDPENERCDELVSGAAKMPNLPADSHMKRKWPRRKIPPSATLTSILNPCLIGSC